MKQKIGKIRRSGWMPGVLLGIVAPVDLVCVALLTGTALKLLFFGVGFVAVLGLAFALITSGFQDLAKVRLRR